MKYISITNSVIKSGYMDTLRGFSPINLDQIQTLYTAAVIDGVAIMMIHGPIDSKDDNGVGTFHDPFVREMAWHKQMGRKVKCLINSPGGSVFGGMSMVESILDVEATTHITGMAASMGFVLAPFGAKATANDFSLGMAHGPSGSKDGEFMNYVKGSLKTCLLGRGKMNEAEIDKMFLKTGNQGTWMNADEMLKKGIIDEIVKTGKKAPVKNIVDNVENVVDVYNIYCKLTATKTRNMENNLITSALGISEDSSDNKITQEIAELRVAKKELAEARTKITTNETKIVELEAKVKTADDAIKVTNESRAKELVEAAIKAKKIKEPAKESWIKNATADYEGTKAMLESIEGTPTRVVNLTSDKKKTEEGKDAVATYEDLRDNNQEELNRLAEEEPAVYDKLVADWQKRTRAAQK